MLAGLQRKNVGLLNYCCYRIGDTQEHLENDRDYINFQRTLANATMEISMYVLENLDQTQTLAENLVEKFFNGKTLLHKLHLDTTYL